MSRKCAFPTRGKFRRPFFTNETLEKCPSATSSIHRDKLIRKGDILKPIRVEEDGRYTVNEESGGPAEDCIYAELISDGYTGPVLSSFGEKDCGALIRYAA